MIDAGERQDFLRKCVARLTEEIEFRIYYVIISKDIAHPKKPET